MAMEGLLVSAVRATVTTISMVLNMEQTATFKLPLRQYLWGTQLKNYQVVVLGI